MTNLAYFTSADTGCLTAVPAANDNSQIARLGAAIGKLSIGRPETFNQSAPANDNLPPVVAFTGPAGAGKSTATRYLVENHGYTLVKFAGPLKDMMRAIGLDERQIEGDLKETPCELLQGRTPRHAMQTLGTQWGRDCIGPSFWLKLWRERAVDILAQAGRVVVDDCRFPNEAQAIRKLGGDIYKIEGRGGISGNHESERGCGDQDLAIANTGGVDELYGKIEEALVRYG
ncbi:deoxynucleotide monophosphate kinase [Rhizobium sp. 768_B6_N1_8]|uniref:deoxynucleotide monophosphate kinase family protein n=1 Tax=unclassified Rhizobium TaxID=2613769 RepID=UPI003F251EEA